MGLIFFFSHYYYFVTRFVTTWDIWFSGSPLSMKNSTTKKLKTCCTAYYHKSLIHQNRSYKDLISDIIHCCVGVSQQCWSCKQGFPDHTSYRGLVRTASSSGSSEQRFNMTSDYYGKPFGFIWKRHSAVLRRGKSKYSRLRLSTHSAGGRSGWLMTANSNLGLDTLRPSKES
jgi:hypothetical protein